MTLEQQNISTSNQALKATITEIAGILNPAPEADPWYRAISALVPLEAKNVRPDLKWFIKHIPNIEYDDVFDDSLGSMVQIEWFVLTSNANDLIDAFYEGYEIEVNHTSDPQQATDVRLRGHEYVKHHFSSDYQAAFEWAVKDTIKA